MWQSKKLKSGFGLVEVVIGAGIVFLIFSGIISVFNFYLKGSVNLTDNLKAEFLTQEGLEALRSMRDSGFLNLSSLPRNSDMYLFFDGSVWSATTTPEVVDELFTRKFRIIDVYRNGAGDIDSSGTLDNDILRAEVSVIWFDNSTTTERTLSTYLGNVFEI